MVMAKIVNAALKAKAWTFEAKAKAKTIKIGLEAKAWPRGLHHWQVEVVHSDIFDYLLTIVMHSQPSL